MLGDDRPNRGVLLGAQTRRTKCCTGVPVANLLCTTSPLPEPREHCRSSLKEVSHAMVDYWSVATMAVIPYAGSAPLSHGTSFAIVSTQKRRFLITNYHVASGRHPATDSPLRTDGITPDRLLFVTYFGKTEKGHWWKPLILPTEQSGTPAWFVHPRYGHEFDVVAIPFPPTLFGAGVPSVPISPRDWTKSIFSQIHARLCGIQIDHTRAAITDRPPHTT